MAKGNSKSLGLLFWPEAGTFCLPWSVSVSLSPYTPQSFRMTGSKRTRPCDTCRRRKTRCHTDERETTCVLCKFHGQQCTYDQTPRHRKRAASLVARADDQTIPTTHGRRLTIPGTGVEEYDALPEGSTLLKRTLGLQNSHHSQYLGINNPLNVYNVGGNSIPETLVRSAGPIQVRFVHPIHAFRILPDAETVGHSLESSILDSIERAVEGHGPDLVSLYFRVVHPAFPILHKEVFLEKYARSYREFAPPLLAAVYLLASGYWDYSDSLASKAKPEMQTLRKLAVDSLQHAMQRAKLSTIQACLLISQHHSNKFDDAFGETDLNMTSQLVQLVHRLGLYLDASDWDIPDWEISLRRRLSWACFMQDKWLAFVQGHPSFISSESWDVSSLTANDFPETEEDETAGSSEVEKGRLVYMNMAELAEILSDVLTVILSPRAQRSIHREGNGLMSLLDRIKPLQIRLKDWFSALPEGLKMDTAASMKLTSVGYLRLAYLSIEAGIHRQITLSSIRGAQHDARLVAICRSAARERFSNTVDFLKRLYASHLASFWYMSSARCAALVYYFGRLLNDSAQSTEEKNELEELLKAYRWALKVNSEAGASFARQSISLIQASEGVSLVGFNRPPSMISLSVADNESTQDMNSINQPATGQLPQHSLSSDQASSAHMFFTGQNSNVDSVTSDWIYDASASVGSWDAESSESRPYAMSL